MPDREEPRGPGDGTAREDERIEAVARRYLDRARAGAPAAELMPLIAELREPMARAIDGVSRHWRIRDAACDREDVLQETMRRLCAKPPTRAPASDRALAVVLARARAAAHNLLHDFWDRHVVRGEQASLDDAEPQVASAPGAPPRPDRQAEARELLQRLRELIERVYPTGLPVLLQMLDDPRSPSAEIGRALGLSSANVDQIRRRIRVHARVLCEGENDDVGG